MQQQNDIILIGFDIIEIDLVSDICERTDNISEYPLIIEHGVYSDNYYNITLGSLTYRGYIQYLVMERVAE